MTLFHNFPFMAAIMGIILAQAIKIPIHYLTNRKWEFNLIFSTGGMPSSHSAATASLTTAIGITEGVTSSYFAITAVFSMIIMFDAAGVRRHAGEQAVVLNKLMDDFNLLIEEMKVLTDSDGDDKSIKLKEVLGHQPIEVLIGGIFGILVGFMTYSFYS